jgi:hypothetical protein
MGKRRQAKGLLRDRPAPLIDHCQLPISLSSPPHGKEETDSNERYQANGFPSSRKLFRSCS